MNNIFKKILVYTVTLSIILSSSVITKQKSVMAYNGRLSMTYLYGNSNEYYKEKINQTKNSLNTVSPSYFDINSDGSLKLAYIDPNFIKDIHDKGIKIVPFLSNHWDRDLGVAALENKELLVEQIVRAINKYKLDGVNIDLENITVEHKNDYTELIRLLRKKLSPDKELSIAVLANPNGYTNSWHGLYDYEKLVKYCDYILVMAYDEHYQGKNSVPGPVASYSFVENSIKYLLRRNVEPNKIVLGMPFYGRLWNDSDTEIRGNSVTQQTAENLAKKYNEDIIFDTNKKSPVVKFTITKDGVQSTVGGQKLTPGNYEVWFENKDSIKFKLDLVNKYNLKGVASWKLGQENSELWDYYSLWLNGKYFKDIIGHWAEDDIIYSIKQGWMVGISDKIFSPNGYLTRAQAATVIVRAMELQDYKVSTKSPFIDLRTDHWAYKNIQIAREKGFMKGVKDNAFAPDKVMTREEVAILIYNILKKDISNNKEYIKAYYNDVTSDRWSYEAIVSMTKVGILKGTYVNKFSPEGKLTRGEMSAIMHRLEKLRS